MENPREEIEEYIKRPRGRGASCHMSANLHRDLVAACRRHSPAVADVAVFCSGVDSPDETTAMKALLAAKVESDRLKAMCRYLEKVGSSEAVDLKVRVRTQIRAMKAADPVAAPAVAAAPPRKQTPQPEEVPDLMTNSLVQQLLLALQNKRPAPPSVKPAAAKKPKQEKVVVKQEKVQEVVVIDEEKTAAKPAAKKAAKAKSPAVPKSSAAALQF